MQPLKCDICGGNIVIEAGGVAVCDSCGMSYTNARIKEKIQEIKGVVQIDNSNNLDNWMRMGDSAVKAENYKEAYDYYTKVIETDPNNWEAVIRRGEAVYYIEKHKNPRINETQAAKERAFEIIEHSGGDERSTALAKLDVVKRVIKTFNQYSSDLFMYTVMVVSKDNFKGGKEEVAYHKLFDLRKKTMELSDEYIHVLEKYDYPEVNDYIRELKEIRLRSLLGYCDFILSYFGGKHWYFGPSKYEKRDLIPLYLPYLEEVVEDQPNFIEKSYPYPCVDQYDAPADRSRQGKDARMKELEIYWKEQWKQYQNNKIAAEKQKKRDAYWEMHKEEKEQLETQLEKAKAEIEHLSKEIKDRETAISSLENQCKDKINEIEHILSEHLSKIRDLEREKSNLGFFAGKQKKELQAQIDSLTSKTADVEKTTSDDKKTCTDETGKAVSTIRSELNELNEKLNSVNIKKEEVENELMKDR